MPDTDRLINKDQGDSIIAAIQGITSRLQEMYTVDDALSSTSENPVQNKVVKGALDGKVDTVSGKGLSTNDYTTAEKEKLAGIEAGAQVNTVVPEDIESTKSASGNPLTLTDCAPINAESLVMELEPKQDLHGQSAPYVGGAGKNKLPMTVDGIKAANTTGTWSGNVYTINGVTLTILTNTGGNVTGIVVNGNASTNVFFNIAGGISIYSGQILNGAPTGGRLYISNSTGTEDYAADTGSGSTISADKTDCICYIVILSGTSLSNVVYYPMLRLSTETDPTFAPYSNICPITGYTECEVDDVGKNLFDISAVKTVEDYNGNSRYGVEIDFVGTITVKANGTTQTGYLSAYVLKVDGTKAQYNYIVSDSTFYTRTFIVSSGEKLVMVHELNDQEETAIWRMTNWLIQAEQGSTATTYEPYHSSNATIQFGQTVYGGKSNFTDGGTDDEWGMLVIDENSNIQSGSSSMPFLIYFPSDAKTTSSIGQLSGDLSNILREVTQQSTWGVECTFSRIANDLAVYFKLTDDITDVATLKTYLASNPLQFCYKKATASTISTPSIDLKLLKGTNNITTNGTTINLGYQPDNVIGEVKGEIEKITEMPYLRILDNDVDTEVKNYRLYYRLISSSYTLVNLAEMLQHRFLFVEVIQNPSGTANHTLLHSALIDPRAIDGFEYQMKAGTGDTVIIESNIAENKFDLSVRYTGTHTSGDPTDYYVTIRMVD